MTFPFSVHEKGEPGKINYFGVWEDTHPTVNK